MEEEQYIKTTLEEELIIKRIVTIHYFEYRKDFVFTGEKHNFWELVYVDKGEINVTADERVFRLEHGEMIFHKPNEFHTLSANGKVAPNLVIISFECKSKASKFFQNKLFSVNQAQKKLLSQIIKEAEDSFLTPLNNPYTTELMKSPNHPFASFQMIKLLLEQLMISLYRANLMQKEEKKPVSIIKERFEQDIVEEIISFLNENIGQTLHFKDIAAYSNISETALKTAFAGKMGTGVMHYFNQMKIEKAKIFIREEQYNFTQIAALLGYDSIHYFSRQFKHYTGMSPSEYAKSVKAD